MYGAYNEFHETSADSLVGEAQLLKHVPGSIVSHRHQSGVQHPLVVALSSPPECFLHRQAVTVPAASRASHLIKVVCVIHGTMIQVDYS
jgi:hypothetical protein